MQRVAPALLVVLWLLAWHSGTHATNRVPTLGMKLCGREFIRAVIFTCGGSRWRRNEVLQAGEPAEVFGNLVSADVNSEEEDMLSEWASSLRPHNSEIDYGSVRHWRDTTGGRHGMAAAAAAEETLRGVERRGREAALGLSNTCCKWGCSKSQISSLC
ncbi:relaxin-3 [Xenopus laevis]|uniref:Relaxin-3 n=1 Tax=Xenopus laevis TaxID=8355 RepID=A0A8J0TUI7_XENLA|nr:relaxin-3 [Xenopus laevis]OCT59400.1 hypothetical protein XELAEV_18000822mg [Xenopus laevis]